MAQVGLAHAYTSTPSSRRASRMARISNEGGMIRILRYSLKVDPVIYVRGKPCPG